MSSSEGVGKVFVGHAKANVFRLGNPGGKRDIRKYQKSEGLEGGKAIREKDIF